jgi:hypothetical protein
MAACTERKIPKVAQAAEFCGVSYQEMRDAYMVSTLPSRSSSTHVLGRCEINRDVSGRVSTRILPRPSR